MDAEDWDSEWDLKGCLQYNPQSFTFEDIEEIAARVEGEGDERDWLWLLKLKSGQYAYLQGGCDYTGWDCQSWAKSNVADTPYRALSEAPADGEYELHKAELLRQLVDGSFRSIRSRVREMLENHSDKLPPKTPPKATPPRPIRRKRRLDF